MSDRPPGNINQGNTAFSPENLNALTGHLNSGRTVYLPASSEWIRSFLSTKKSTIPFKSLASSAEFSLKYSNITCSLAPPPSGLFPADIASPLKIERKLEGPITVQVLDFEDITRSKWDQIEELEAKARGEGKAGLEVIRVVRDEEDGPDLPMKQAGMLKLLVEDAKGTRAWAVEQDGIPHMKEKIAIGGKILFRNILVARGLILMTPESTTYLGGVLEEAHKKWMDARLEKLKATVSQR